MELSEIPKERKQKIFEWYQPSVIRFHIVRDIYTVIQLTYHQYSIKYKFDCFLFMETFFLYFKNPTFYKKTLHVREKFKSFHKIFTNFILVPFSTSMKYWEKKWGKSDTQKTHKHNSQAHGKYDKKRKMYDTWLFNYYNTFFIIILQSNAWIWIVFSRWEFVLKF